MALFGGRSSAATGTITANTASRLAFADEKRYVIISNESGQKAYLKINDAATPTVSASDYDLALADGSTFTLEDVAVEAVGVYVNATSGVRVVGWD